MMPDRGDDDALDTFETPLAPQPIRARRQAHELLLEKLLREQVSAEACDHLAGKQDERDLWGIGYEGRGLRGSEREPISLTIGVPPPFHFVVPGLFGAQVKETRL